MTLRRLLAAALPGQPARVQGWISSVRKMKNFAFADVTDGSSPKPLSVVLTPDQAEPLTTGACVDIAGTIQIPPGRAKNGAPREQKVEVHAESASILGECGSDYPLQKKYHSREFLRQYPHFRWKTRSGAQVLRYRSYALRRLGEFFESQEVTQVNSPILTASDCEGAGEVFEIAKSTDFFGKPAYLSVSSQLHLEVYAAALGRVWNMAPAFRAEASDTNRHLSEFWMVETELAFVDSVKQVTDFCEAMVKATVPAGEIAEEMLSTKRDAETRDRLAQNWALLAGPWDSITYSQAVDELNAADGVPSAEWGADLSSEQEKYLAGKRGRPLFVTDYPQQIKPFYMKRSRDFDPAKPTVACFDLLIPGVGELVGGSLREDNYELLMSNVASHSMDAAGLSWYTDLRKYGSFPHGGYGLGFERLIMYVCGLDNIREATGFVRGFNQCPC